MLRVAVELPALHHRLKSKPQVVKALLEHVVDAGFAKPGALDLCRFVAAPQQVIDALREALAERD